MRSTFLHSLFILFFMLFLNGSITAQTAEDLKEITSEYPAELHSFSLYGENNLFPKNGDFTYHFGARLDLSLGVVGLYYKLGVGKSPDGTIYVHIPAGLAMAGVGAWYGLSAGNYYLWVPIVLLAMIPEGITVRIWQRNNVAFQLYASPWGVELNYFKDYFTPFSGEFGLRINVIQKNRYNLSGYAGAKAIYDNFRPAATVGATAGFLLR